MGLNIRSFVHLTTPQYLIIGIIPPISAYLLINRFFPGFEIIPIIISIIFAILGFNIFNQLTDIEIDKVDKPLRPLISKEVSINEARFLSITFYAASLFLALYINLTFFILMIIFALLTLLYCNKLTYFKKYSWGSSFVGIGIYGIIPFLAAASISTKSFNPIFLIFFSLLFMIISNTKDFEDMPGEKKFGINSLPLILGPEKASELIVLSQAFLIILIGIFAYLNYIEPQFIYAAGLSFLLLILISYLFFKEIRKIKFKNIAFTATNNIEIRKIITQSEAPTLSIIFVSLVQLIFGLTAISLF